ncbi:MAG: hypothetical protein AB7F89_09825 [Pirellulaceae bacterium]
MTFEPEFVEFIVQEVLRRLAAGGLVVAPEGGAGALPAQELVLADRLVTLATVQGRLNGVRSLVVPGRAVVTPAVRDELRARGIHLRREEPCGSPK